MRISKLIKTIVYALLASLILVVVKDEFAHKLLDNANYGMPALIEKGYVKELYTGSSLFRQGLEIDILEDDSDDVYILSYNGNQPIFEYEQLKNVIEQGVEIEKVYVDMYVGTLWADPDISDEKYLMELGLIGMWNTYQSIQSSDNSIKLFWQTFVTSNNELIWTWPISSRLINSQFKKGGSTLKPSGSTKEYLDSLNVHTISGDMNTKQEQAIRNIIGLCKDKGIDICFIESPKYVTSYENSGYIEAMNAYVELLRDLDVDIILLDRTLAGIDVLGANRVQKSKDSYGEIIEDLAIGSYGFECDNPDYYSDLLHLSYEGRKRFSNELRKVIDNKY